MYPNQRALLSLEITMLARHVMLAFFPYFFLDHDLFKPQPRDLPHSHNREAASIASLPVGISPRFLAVYLILFPLNVTSDLHHQILCKKIYKSRVIVIV